MTMSVAEAFVNVRPQMSNFGNEMERGLPLARFAKMGALAGGAIVAAAGTALFKMGETVHEAFSTIRIGTGATGDALDGLMDDFRAVGRSVPADLGEVSTAIADLNTRLGITGEPLQDLAGQFLDLARITGGEVSEQIRGATRVFGDWGVELDDQADTLDKFFRGAQESGAEIGRLMDQVVQFGAPLRGMGFDLEESIALFADFEREGVNAELVIGSLRQALGRMAREGEEAPETFRRLIEEIEGAESRTEATRVAMEVFGARAGPDMAAAIQEGRLEFGEMLAAIESGEDTIAQASEDTRGFSEAWQEFKNNALLALEPVATRVFESLAEGMAVVAEWLGQVGNRFAELMDASGESTSAMEDHLSSYTAAVGTGAGNIEVDLSRFTAAARDAESNTNDSFESMGEFMGRLWNAWKTIWDEDIAPWFLGTVVPWVETVLAPALGRALWSAGKTAGSRFWSGFSESFQENLPGGRLTGIEQRFWDRIPGWPPEFHDGGIVPGLPGQEVPALLMAGETVLPTHDSGKMGRFTAGGGGDLHVHGDINVGSRRDYDDLNWEVRKIAIANY